MLYFPTPPAAMSAANARNAISQMNLYGYTTQSMIPSRRMEMEARGRFMAANPMAAAAYGTLPMPVGNGGGGRSARLRWSDREKISNNKTAAASAANDNEAGDDADEEEDVDENRNSKGGAGRATRNKASAGG